jgi:hypothetical protein
MSLKFWVVLGVMFIFLQPLFLGIVAAVVVCSPLIFIFSLFSLFLQVDKLKKQLKSKQRVSAVDLAAQGREAFSKLFSDVR